MASSPRDSSNDLQARHITVDNGRVICGQERPVEVEILVISLQRATDRRAAIKQQFDELGLPFNFLDAVDGQHHHPLFEKYNARKAWLIGEIPLSPGHLGCYASHYLAWQHCVSDGQPKIVLEDDALLHEENFLTFLEHIPELPRQLQCVRLFSSKSRKSTNIPVFSRKDLTIAKFTRGHKSATGYFLTAEGASKFLDHAQSWAEPLDIEMDQFWANKVECFGTLQPCLTNNSDFDSAIDTGVDTAKARRGLMRRRWRIYNWLIRVPRTIHNLAFLLKWSVRKSL